MRYDAELRGIDLFGSFAFRAPRERVWSALRDPRILKQCIPGCEDVRRGQGGTMTAAVALATGPIDAKIKCRLRLFDLEMPTTCTISGEGDAGRAGFATGTAKFKLEQTDEGAALSYFGIARMGGTLARLGARRLDDLLKTLSSQFLESLRKCVEDGAPADDPKREPV